MLTLKSKIDARLEARRSPVTRAESGLAMLDVLLGMAIFALIAVIAVQSMGQFRGRAYVTAATSDANQIEVAIESYMTDNDAYPPEDAATGGGATSYPDWDGTGTDASTTNLSGLGVKLSPGNTVGRYNTWTDGSGVKQFYLCVVHRDSSGAIDAWVGYYSPYNNPIYQSGVGPAPGGSTVCGPMV